MFEEYWIKWLFAGIGAALTAIINFVIKQVKRGHDLIKEEEKEDFLREVFERLDNCEERLDTAEETLQTLKAADLKNNIDKIINTIETMQKGILSLHFDALLKDCKYWINQEWIPLDALEKLEEKYNLYKELGGNGHMEPWMKRVRSLPNQNK